jgi:hypothetical protein
MTFPLLSLPSNCSINLASSSSSIFSAAFVEPEARDVMVECRCLARKERYPDHGCVAGHERSGLKNRLGGNRLHLSSVPAALFMSAEHDQEGDRVLSCLTSSSGRTDDQTRKQLQDIRVCRHPHTRNRQVPIARLAFQILLPVLRLRKCISMLKDLSARAGQLDNLKHF